MVRGGSRLSSKALQHLAAFEPRKALPILRREADKSPTYGALVNYAAAQRGVGRILEAKETLHRAMSLDLSRPEAWSNLGQISEDLGEFDKAPPYFQRALECIEKSGVPVSSAGEPLLGFAYSLMRLGQFQFVWPIWEAARLNKTWTPFQGLHAWKGEPDARLLVLPEGGFGDGFNFLRWIEWLPAAQITILVWDSMFEYTSHVFRRRLSTGDTLPRVLPISHKFKYDELAQYTHCTPYLSLMVHSMKTWADIPPPLDWEPRGRLVAPPNDWIGFCWRAEENGVMRQIRSLDRLTASRVGKHLAANCERVVGLVPSGKHMHREGVSQAPRGVTQDDSLLVDWEHTALTMLKCRLIVTVDTAIAHLAASLGIPTLILLPLRSDWKFGLPPATTTAFYGRNVKLYRSLSPTDWDVAEICKAIDGM